MKPIVASVQLRRKVQLLVVLATASVGLFACERSKPSSSAAGTSTEAAATDANSQNGAGAEASGAKAALSSAFQVDSSNLNLVPAYAKAYSDALDALKADLAAKKISGKEAMDRLNRLPLAIGLASPDGASVPAKMFPYAMTIGQLTGAVPAVKSRKIAKDGSPVQPSPGAREEDDICRTVIDHNGCADVPPAELDPPPPGDFWGDIVPALDPLPGPPPLPPVPDIDPGLVIPLPKLDLPKLPPLDQLPNLQPDPPRKPDLIQCNLFGVPGKCCRKAEADQCTIYFAIPLRRMPPLYYFGSCQWKRDVGFIGCPNAGTVTGWRCPPKDPNAC